MHVASLQGHEALTMGAKIIFRMRNVGNHPERLRRLRELDLRRRQLNLFSQDNSGIEDPYYGPYQNVRGLVRDLDAMRNNARGRSSSKSASVSNRQDPASSRTAAPIQNNRARQSKSTVGTRGRRTASGARAIFPKQNPW